ncbi:MAG TPA: FKBP-type peptidyl-prolyl cis-trans isomerase [Gemmatimonadaceae bacterium]
MRRLFLFVPMLGAAGCLSTTALPDRIAIDCETLATSVAASAPSLTTTASGLQYRDVTVGTGPTVVNGSIIGFHYSGCLVPSGTKFDENTNVDPLAVVQVGSTQTIPGFNEGVVGMNAGGRRQLVIPPELAYGAAGAKDASGNVIIPPNATLVFTVDLLQVQ